MKNYSVLSFAFICGGACGILLLLTAVPLGFMDLNVDGKVEIRELIKALDVSTRSSTKVEGRCIEVFSLKDGTPISTHCLEN